MPKIKITETDNTSAIQLSSVSNIVYIPGLSASGNFGPKLYVTSKSIEDDVKSGYLVADSSYKLAHRLLQMGMQVLYEGCPTSESGSPVYDDKEFTTKIQVGEEEVSGDEYNYFKVQGIGSGIEFIINDNNTVTFTDDQEQEHTVEGINGVYNFEGEIEEYTIKTAIIDVVAGTVKYVKTVTVSATSIQVPDYEKLQDKNEYNIRFLTAGAYVLDVPGKMLECASKRGDCVALVDHPKDYTSVNAVRQYFAGDGTSGGKLSSVAGEYCSAFTPWIEVELPEGDKIELPGSAGYLLAYARSVQTNPSWYAAAGAFRGIISGLVKPLVKYSKADCEQLQARAAIGEVGLDESGDNVGISINPICNISPFGYIVFGNRTALNNTGSTKATSFLNVRNLISTLKKELYATANKYTFEQNNEVLWINFKSQVSTLLDQMQSGNGIEGYRFVRQATDKKARLKAKIVIIPIEAVEDFELEVSLEDSLEVVE